MVNLGDRFSRRDIVRMGLSAGMLARWPSLAAALTYSSPPLPVTPGIEMGPFYPVIKPLDRDGDLTLLRGKRRPAAGQIIHVHGRVLNQRGEPVRKAQVELWQANTYGRYDHPSDTNPAPLDPNFQGYAVQLTDGEGRFHFKTVKPGAYPATPTWTRPPHLHIEVTGRMDRTVTQMFFKGEPLNEKDVLFQQVGENREGVIAPVLPPTGDVEPESLLVPWDIVIPQG
jgi:protocatechuate 3,4-dioxygenase beta subunit